jgi:DNA-binding transcriptional ArsR family regulator
MAVPGDDGDGGARGGGALRDRPDRAESVFEALADPTRRTVMRSVAELGPVTATQLAARLPVTRQAVAKHLDALRDAGLVEGRREGRELRFELTPAPLADAMRWMEDVGGAWDRRLASLHRHLARRR